MKIVLLGLPLSGKGTQGKFLAEKLKLPRLSVGALLRKHYINQTKEGIEAYKYTSKGKAVPAKLLFKILDIWFKNNPQGFVVDNLIRSKDQLDEFKNYCKNTNFQIDYVFNLNITRKTLNERFQTRIYEHQRKNKLRVDENDQALKNRIDIYENSKKEILNFFKENSKLFQINADQSVVTVNEDIVDILKIKPNGDN